jgi:hypothetical protein
MAALHRSAGVRREQQGVREALLNRPPGVDVRLSRMNRLRGLVRVRVDDRRARAEAGQRIGRYLGGLARYVRLSLLGRAAVQRRLDDERVDRGIVRALTGPAA